MVSDPDTEKCANEEDESRRGVDTRQCASKDVEPYGGWIRGSHINWRSERVPARMLGPEKGGL